MNGRETIQRDAPTPFRWVTGLIVAAAAAVGPAGCASTHEEETRPGSREITARELPPPQPDAAPPRPEGGVVPSSAAAGHEGNGGIGGSGSGSPGPRPSPDLLVETLGDAKGMITKFYRIRHIDGATLIATLAAWKSARGRLVDYPELNMVILTDLPDHLAVMEEVLDRIDVLTPQVEIEAKVIEIRRTNNFDYGFELHIDRNGTTKGAWRKLDGTLDSQSFLDSLLPNSTPNPSPFAFQGTSLEFVSVGKVLEELGAVDFVVQALVEEGYAEILSSPRVLVHNGHEAELNTVTRIPIQETVINNNATTVTTRYETVGVKLKVKPELIGTDAILLHVNPEVSSVTGFSETTGPGSAAVPIISSRNARTIIDIQDGETLVIGGLYEKRVVNREKRLPILGSIPLIGHFFSSRQEQEEKTEIIFILKTTILSEVEKARARLRVPTPK